MLSSELKSLFLGLFLISFITFLWLINMTFETLIGSGVLAFLFAAGVFVGRSNTRSDIIRIETQVELQYKEIIRRLEFLESKS